MTDTPDTPETDGEWNRLACQDHPEFERNLGYFARKLERERDESRKWGCMRVFQLAQERDEIRAQLREEQRLHAQTLNERDEARQWESQALVARIQRDEAREQVQQLNHQIARSQEDDDLLMIAWMHGAESNRRQCRDLARERDRLRDALRAIIGCGLNCKDALDEAEQMERIAKEALSTENANSPPTGEKEA